METLNASECTPVYYVHASKIDALNERFEKIARRAVRLGLTAPKLVTHASFEQRVTEYLHQFGDGGGPPTGEKITIYPRVVCTVEGVSPVLNGWRLLAAIEHIENETMIYVFDESADLTAFRGASNYCEHCKTDRRRQSTFVVRHEDGTVKQIGRNCLVDFIGNADACRWFVASAEMLSRAVEACEDEEMVGFGGSGIEPRYPLDFYLSFVWSSIREFGWQAKQGCPEGAIPTATRVLMTLSGRPMPKGVAPVSTPTEVDQKRAEESIEFVRQSTQTTEFFENLRVICRLGTVREKHAGLAAALAPVFDRELRRRAEAAERRPSVFVGTVGERMILTLTLAHVWYTEGDYGIRCFARFNDQDGNDYIWIASGEPEWLHKTDKDEKNEARIGETFTVKGTVKKHENDRRSGRPTTVLTRVQPYEPPAPKTPKPRRKKGDLTAKQEKAIEYAREWRESCDARGYGNQIANYKISVNPGWKQPACINTETIDSLVALGIAFRSDEWGFPNGGYSAGSWGLTEWRNNNEASDVGGTASQSQEV